MCAQFLIEANRLYLERTLGISLPREFEPYDRRILPYSKAPVLRELNGQKIIEEMVFSLIPPWSDKPKAAFATHNARLDGLKDIKKKVAGKEVVEEKYSMIYDSGLWKGPLSRARCVVPISAFREPLYWGPFAGHWATFRPKGDALLVAAGLYSEWTDKKTGESVPSFTIITDDPYADVEIAGHSRSPLFMEPEAIDRWIKDENLDGPQAFAFLREHRDKLNFDIEVAEPMAKGWEKRVPLKEKEFQEEAAFRNNRSKLAGA